MTNEPDFRDLASDEDGARAAAQERLDQSLATLGQTGIHARGQVGDADPLQAIEDALRTFGAEEIIISTHPQGRSNWLERRIVSYRARALSGTGYAHNHRPRGRSPGKLLTLRVEALA